MVDRSVGLWTSKISSSSRIPSSPLSSLSSDSSSSDDSKGDKEQKKVSKLIGRHSALIISLLPEGDKCQKHGPSSSLSLSPSVVVSSSASDDSVGV